VADSSLIAGAWLGASVASVTPDGIIKAGTGAKYDYFKQIDFDRSFAFVALQWSLMLCPRDKANAKPIQLR